MKIIKWNVCDTFFSFLFFRANSVDTSGLLDASLPVVSHEYSFFLFYFCFHIPIFMNLCDYPGVGGDEAGPDQHAIQTGRRSKPVGNRQNRYQDLWCKKTPVQTYQQDHRRRVPKQTQTHCVCKCLTWQHPCMSHLNLSGQKFRQRISGGWLEMLHYIFNIQFCLNSRCTALVTLP